MSNDKLNQMKAIYFRLGTGKIIEGMEKSFFDNYGPYVFDRGLHGGAIEPGFKRSWERAAHFLSYQFQRKVNAKLYLELHAYACDHFMGALNGVLMDQSKIGTFRDSSESAVIWTCSATPDGIYVVTDEAEQALNEMNQEIQARFNTTLGTFDRSTPGKIILRYTTMDKETVAKIYNYFADTMYRELERAQTEDDKFTAICKFFRNCEWLHSVRDGCGRCDLLIFNFLLTQNGFHPTCCNSPYLANTIGLEGWKTYVREGMQTWSLLKSG